MSQDLTEIDDLVAAFFAVFDSRSGRIPDLSKLEEIFVPEAIITKCGGGQEETMSLQEFIVPRAEKLSSGELQDFHEWESGARTFVHGSIATRISRYEKEGTLNGERFSGQGVKSIQLLRTSSGWKIVSILWEDFED